MRACPSCIQQVLSEPSKEKRNAKQKHFWAAVGYDFKSDLTFYDVPGNKNDKMSQQVYIDSILNPVVKSWLEEAKRNDYEFTLEEDEDSEHDPDKSNIVRT